MDKIQKYEFVKKAKEYLDEKKITDLFKNLTKQLLIHRPDSPIDFLIDRLQKLEPIRVFIVGPPGSISKMLARRITKEADFTTISAGEIMKKEASKLSEEERQSRDEIDTHRVVCDNNLSYIIKNHILKNENENKNWILEGFPKTKTQALSLQRIGIIPDIFVLLDVERGVSLDKIRKNLVDNNTSLIGEDLDNAAEVILSEYELQIEGVKESYNKFINHFHVNKPMDEMEADLLQMVRNKVENPMIPPGIVLPEKIIDEEEIEDEH